jgi:hypothetical protein
LTQKTNHDFIKNTDVDKSINSYLESNLRRQLEEERSWLSNAAASNSRQEAAVVVQEPKSEDFDPEFDPLIDQEIGDHQQRQQVELYTVSKIGLRLQCKRKSCGHIWLYQGKSKFRASCPVCLSTVTFDIEGVPRATRYKKIRNTNPATEEERGGVKH